jgi:hypothetical protein
VDDETYIEYLDKKYFDDSLEGGPGKLENILTAKFSILQKWFEPMGSKENIIVCDWSDSLCLIKKIENEFEFKDKFCAKIRKYLTFSAPNEGTSELPVCDPRTIEAVGQTCVSIRDKFLNDTFGSLHLNRMLLTFKLDESQNLQFLWPAKITKMPVHENFTKFLDWKAIHTLQAFFRDDPGSLDHEDPSQAKNMIFAAQPKETQFDAQKKNLQCFMCAQNRAQGQYVSMNHKDIISFYRIHKKKFAGRLFSGSPVGARKTMEDLIEKEYREQCDRPPPRDLRRDDKIPNYFVNKYPMVDMNWWDNFVLKNLNF